MSSMRNPFGLSADCRRCPALLDARGQVVHGYGPRDAAIMFVGRAPHVGGSADTGVPFTQDDAGRRFLWLMARAGLYAAGDRDATEPALACFVTNAIRCAPPGNRRPRASELRRCAAWLGDEIVRVDPSVLIPIGAAAGRSVYELLGERFPGARAAYKTTLTRYGYRVHPIIHPLRAGAEQLRAIATHLGRIAAHTRASSPDLDAPVDGDYVERLAFRFSLAIRAADAHARAVSDDAEDPRYWISRMEHLAETTLDGLRGVSLPSDLAVRFRFLGERRGKVFLAPYAVARDAEHRDERDPELQSALRVTATPRGVLEYWMLHRELWTVADALRWTLIPRDGRLDRWLWHDGAPLAVDLSPMRRSDSGQHGPPSARPRVSVDGASATVTVLLVRQSRGLPRFRVVSAHIDLRSGRVRYLRRENLSVAQAVERPRWRTPTL